MEVALIARGNCVIKMQGRSGDEQVRKVDLDAFGLLLCPDTSCQFRYR